MTDLSGWPILDVAIGLAFLFFLLSIVASSVYELIAAWLSLRAKNLKQAIKSLLGSSLADDLYKNWRIRALFKDPDKPDSRGPSYIPPSVFAHALLESLAVKGAADSGTPMERAMAAVQSLPAATPRIKAQLTALLESGGDQLETSVKAAEQLFNDRMERASGWYKRKTQYVMWVIAAFVAFALNVNTFHVASELWKNDSLRAAVVTQAKAVLETPVSAGEKSCPAGQVLDDSTQAPKDCKPDPKALSAVADSIDDVQQLDIPVGWSQSSRPSWWTNLTFGSLLGWLFGCIITAAAVSLGAPFWFNALQKLGNLRSSGKRPSDDDSKRGDADLLVDPEAGGEPAKGGGGDEAGVT